MKILVGILAVLCFSGVAWAGNFTDNHNGTVVDNVTGLWWQQQDDGVTRNWLTAISYCSTFNVSGLFGWRLPNRNELESLTDDSRYNPALDPAIFPNAKPDGYWTSTTNTAVTTEAVTVSFYNGVVSGANKTIGLYARCVRNAPVLVN